MKYKVNEDFPLELGKAGDPEVVKAGEVFIPAEINYPLNKVEALVKAGTIEPIVPEAPKAAASHAKKK